MSSPTAPGEYPTRQLNTLFLRVPVGDWNEVRIGKKRQFRTKPREGSLILGARCPTPVVLYAVDRAGKHACKLALLEEQRRERLIDIADNPSDLSLEGFESYDQFKAYWKKRNNGVFRALQSVVSHKVRPWTKEDEEQMGRLILDRLYGHFIPQGITMKSGRFSEFLL